MKQIGLISIVLIVIGCNSYAQTITIGSQTWMTKNLDVSTFRNGDPIPEAKTDDEWLQARINQQPAWCYYYNDTAYGKKYGKLYNWYAVNDPRGLAPVGFHIPSDKEWTVLTDFLGGEKVAAEKMKSGPVYETRISYVYEGGYYEKKWVECSNCKSWSNEYRRKVPCHVCKDQRGKTIQGKYVPKTKRKVEEKIKIDGWIEATNESGFSGLTSGHRDTYGIFTNLGLSGGFWSSTEYKDETGLAWHRYLPGRADADIRNKSNKGTGYSVRCLKD